MKTKRCPISLEAMNLTNALLVGVFELSIYDLSKVELSNENDGSLLFED